MDDITSTAKGVEVWNQFTTKNTKNTPVSKVAVFKIHMPASKVQQYESYRDSVIADNPPVFGSGGPGNCHRRFHGTNLTCSLSPSSTQLCNQQGCSVCGILQNGFLLNFSQTKHGWGRFGRGLYFSSTSSKSLDYTNPNGSGVRAIFVAYVMVGKGRKLTSDDPARTSAGSGFHSVLGEVGQVLNYDEIVTYDNSSALPGYLILVR